MVPLLQLVISDHALVFSAQDWDMYHNKKGPRTLGPWDRNHLARMKKVVSVFLGSRCQSHAPGRSLHSRLLYSHTARRRLVLDNGQTLP